ncbi:hypothetical protein WJX73_002493 [Symbiochloris irregularis]|uniref:protein-serine/threonine phosphatase n=1 Tax=Symbiochloris irregularis TaxID=706552 RepID=A0AAW1NY38_9CHLO
MSSASSGDLEDGELPPDPSSQQPTSPPVTGADSHSHRGPASTVPENRAEAGHRARSQPAQPSLPAYEASRSQSNLRHANKHRRDSLPQQVADLTATIKKATSQVAVKHGLKSPEALCNNLWTAVQSCQALCKILSEVDNLAKTADDHALLAEMAGRLHSGLRTLHVVSGTGTGRSTFTPASRAADIIRTVFASRTKLFTVAQRRDIDKWVSSSKVFSAMLSHGDEHEKSADSGLDGSGPRKRPRLEFGDASVVPSFLSLPERARAKRASTPSLPETPQLQLARTHAPSDKGAAPRSPAETSPPLLLSSAQTDVAPGKVSESAEVAARPTNSSTTSSRISSGEILLSSQPHNDMDTDQQSALVDTAAGPARPSTPQSPDSRTSAQKPPLAKAPKTKSKVTANGFLAVPGLSDAGDHEPQLRLQANGRPRQKPAGLKPPSPPTMDPPSPPSSPLLPPGPPSSPLLPPLPPPSPGAGSRQSSPGPPRPPALPPSPPEALKPPGAPLKKGTLAPPASPTSPVVGSRPSSPAIMRAPPAIDNLLRQSKLCLVLDLDHTLLNSARFTERASLFFQLWIHTNGNRTYALAIAELLDPTGELFQGRVIAQGAEDGAATTTTKRLMQGLEDLESIALVVDDTSSVWHHHADSLLTVERYVFFPSSKQALGMTGDSFLESRRDEHGEHGMLMMALQVLMRVHIRVFRNLSDPSWHARALEDAATQPPWDARVGLRTERAKVLQGTVVMFSGFTPVSMRPEEHHLWIMAESFGARCTSAKADDVTHLVARQGGTEKVFWAGQMKKWVVSKGWLECSCVLWKRAAETDYLLPVSQETLHPLPTRA